MVDSDIKDVILLERHVQICPNAPIQVNYNIWKERNNLNGVCSDNKDLVAIFSEHNTNNKPRASFSDFPEGLVYQQKK